MESIENILTQERVIAEDAQNANNHLDNIDDGIVSALVLSEQDNILNTQPAVENQTHIADLVRANLILIGKSLGCEEKTYNVYSPSVSFEVLSETSKNMFNSIVERIVKIFQYAIASIKQLMLKITVNVDMIEKSLILRQALINKLVDTNATILLTEEEAAGVVKKFNVIIGAFNITSLEALGSTIPSIVLDTTAMRDLSNSVNRFIKAHESNVATANIDFSTSISTNSDTHLKKFFLDNCSDLVRNSIRDTNKVEIIEYTHDVCSALYLSDNRPSFQRFIHNKNEALSDTHILNKESLLKLCVYLKQLINIFAEYKAESLSVLGNSNMIINMLGSYRIGNVDEENKRKKERLERVAPYVRMLPKLASSSLLNYHKLLVSTLWLITLNYNKQIGK